MKKLVSLLLAVCVCLSVSIMLTACKEEHTHTYKTEWSKDATHHWHACEGEACTEISDKAEHIWNDGVITTPATKEAQGVKTFTCTVCAQTKTAPTEYEPKTTVTADEWNGAFDLGDNWTLTYVATHPTYQQTITITQKRDGNKFHSSEVMSDATGVLDSDDSYDEIVDNVWYWYHRDPQTQTYLKSPQSESVDEHLAMLIESYLPQFVRNMSNFDYDETNQVYFAETLENSTPGGSPLLDVTIAFEDGKIVSFAYSLEMGGVTVPYSATFTYGGAVVILPTVE